MKEKVIEECTSIIQNSTNIVVLTGAGISTESGIPDFRSRTGIYQETPEELLSIDYFYDHPKKFYQFAMENLHHPRAVPNIGHELLAKWEEKSKITHLITQNIDGLHQKAGSKNVIEFHGTMKTCSCMNCGKTYLAEEMVKRMKESDHFYVCNHCETQTEEHHYIKPDVVLFGDSGQWFTYDGFKTITDMIHRADCLLVLGSSLKVTPFSTFPRDRQPGVPLIIVNKGTTAYDLEPNTYVIQNSIRDTLKKIDLNLEA
ncbi:NAD-dependent protein deacylase [Bacillus sp. 1NLA3E]|uniref:NAD-dependent protein deacylase n=1 Tax=Bacillus sp. 1NLA3E TaxID=666686 RepID=UPI000247E457|nr:NAD-dependent protein deacylase [Bacillus sp. 1NLA3E]AGK54184.1 NAD-dependent deacetylase [Bacillus sp. 1NLA3E]